MSTQTQEFKDDLCYFSEEQESYLEHEYARIAEEMTIQEEEAAELEAEEEAPAGASQPAPKKRTRKPYNPGTVGEVIPEGHGRYIVQSFRDRGDFYSVDLNDGENGSCTCPHTLKRDAQTCKHREAARMKAYQEAREKAESVDLDALRNLLLFKYSEGNRPEIAEALSVEIHYRERAAETLAGIARL
jgi:hypothetical protein